MKEQSQDQKVIERVFAVTPSPSIAEALTHFNIARTRNISNLDDFRFRTMGSKVFTLIKEEGRGYNGSQGDAQELNGYESSLLPLQPPRRIEMDHNPDHITIHSRLAEGALLRIFLDLSPEQQEVISQLPMLNGSQQNPGLFYFIKRTRLVNERVVPNLVEGEDYEDALANLKAAATDETQAYFQKPRLVDPKSINWLSSFDILPRLAADQSVESLPEPPLDLPRAS